MMKNETMFLIILCTIKKILSIRKLAMCSTFENQLDWLNCGIAQKLYSMKCSWSWLKWKCKMVFHDCYQVFLGDPHSCTCTAFRKEKDLCKHICWILLKKFRLNRDDPCKSFSLFFFILWWWLMQSTKIVFFFVKVLAGTCQGCLFTLLSFFEMRGF